MKLSDIFKKDKARETLRYGKAIKKVLQRKIVNKFDESEDKVDRNARKNNPCSENLENG